jgi:DNA modification methylase
LTSAGIRLDWNGRHAAQTEISPLPELTSSEIYGTATAEGWRNRLIQGDNLAIMAALRAEVVGKVDLIYLDPPFFTGAEWHAQMRGGRDDTLPAYSDDWNGQLGDYLQWLLDRLTLARELLSPTGSLYVHLNWHAAHYVKLLLDEIFGLQRFQNEIIWCYREAINSKKRWNRKHDTLLFYSKGERFTFNPDPVREKYKESHIEKYRQRDEQGVYRLMGRGIHGSPVRSHRDLPPEAEAQYPGLTYRHYLGQGTLPVDYWLIDIENQNSHNRTGYPTQKPEALLERILLASSNPGDLVADLCCGSGTTPAVAQRLGRRWIASDLGSLAIHTCRKRLLETCSSGDFGVETLGGNAVAVSEAPAAAWVRLEHSGDSATLHLCEEAVPTIDMWAVEWLNGACLTSTSIDCGSDNSPQPFRPNWWSVRTRRHPNLIPTSEPYPLSHVTGFRVMILDAGGNATIVEG